MKRSLILFLSLFACAPAYCELGETSNSVRSGDWYSMKLCGFEGCLWRALTINRSTTLVVDFYSNGNHSISLITDVPASAVSSWDEGSTDTMPARVRIDYTPIIETVFSRNFQRQDMLIFANFNPKQFGKQFVNALKRGLKLRIQQLADRGTITTSYSLRGAARAITRAQNNAWGTAPERRDEDFFNTPITQSPHNQEARQSRRSDIFDL